MLKWLFGLKSLPTFTDTEIRFSNLPIGQEFTKNGDNTIYVKVNESEFETAEDWHCIKWYLVREDFMVKI